MLAPSRMKTKSNEMEVRSQVEEKRRRFAESIPLILLGSGSCLQLVAMDRLVRSWTV